MVKMMILLLFSIYGIYSIQATREETTTTQVKKMNLTITINIDDDSNKTQPATCPQPLQAETSLWCPYNYQLVYINGWTRLCRPAPCIEVRNETAMAGILSNDTCIEQVESNQSSMVRLCDRLRIHSLTFQHCPKVQLTEDQYQLRDNGYLWIKSHNTSLSLKDYWISENGSVTVCDNNNNNNYYNDSNILTNNTLPWCIPVSNADNDYQKKFISNLLEEGHLVLAESKQRATVCIQTSETLSRCQQFEKYLLRDAILKTNRDIIHMLSLHKYSFGDYFFDVNRSAFYICDENMFEIITMINYINGGLSLLSPTCLLIVIFLHLFSPDFNYHSKALIGHALSLFVAYMNFAISRLNQGIDDEIKLIASFYMQYTSVMAAFLWLNVVAFELWRGFSAFNNSSDEQGRLQKVDKFQVKNAF